jgi:hypothetical protein
MGMQAVEKLETKSIVGLLVRLPGSVSDGRVIVEVEMMGCIVPIQIFPNQIARFA